MNIFDKTEPVCMTLATRVAKHPMHATGDPQVVGNACIVSLGRIDLHSSNPTRSIGVELSSSPLTHIVNNTYSAHTNPRQYT